MLKLWKVQVYFYRHNQIEVTLADKSKKVISFDSAIIAAGSQPTSIPGTPDDPRIMDSTGALELKDIPRKTFNCWRWELLD